MRFHPLQRLLIILAVTLGVGAVQAQARSPETKPPIGWAVQAIGIPGGAGGIGFDDLGYSPELGRLLVPAGRTGNLDLLDPVSGTITSISGFGSAPRGVRGAHGHGEGTTSADFGHGLLFAIDHDSQRLVVVDPKAHKIVSSAALASGPDYVRWIAPTSEIWVTEPGAEQIEVFALSAADQATPVRKTAITVPGGPESLVIDAKRNWAYTNLWTGTTVAVQLEGHTIAARWSNHCQGSRGLALDARRGLLFVGCAEGKAAVLNVGQDGRVLDTFDVGAGVDIIAYDAARSLLYVPGGRSASLAVLGVSAGGALSLVATVKTAHGAHCVTVDERHRAWVCDPGNGRLLRVSER